MHGATGLWALAAVLGAVAGRVEGRLLCAAAVANSFTTGYQADCCALLAPSITCWHDGLGAAR